VAQPQVTSCFFSHQDHSLAGIITELLCFHVYTVEVIFPNVLLVHGTDLLKDWIAVNLFMGHHHLSS
jgi:hypothetical protein